MNADVARRMVEYIGRSTERAGVDAAGEPRLRGPRWRAVAGLYNMSTQVIDANKDGVHFLDVRGGLGWMMGKGGVGL